MRIARATRTVTCGIVPNDVQEASYEPPPREHGAVFSSGQRTAAVDVAPAAEELRRAAAVLKRRRQGRLTGSIGLLGPSPPTT